MTLRLGQPWDKDDIKAMRTLAKQKQPASYVARVLGRSRGAVAFKAMTLKIRFHSIEQPRDVQRKIQRSRVRRNRSKK